MNKCVIVGAGQMGVAVAYAMVKLGFKVVLSDIDEDTLNTANEKLNSLKRNHDFKEYKNIRFSSLTFSDNIDTETDIIISAAPFHANYNIAKLCIDKGVHYCDLGGDPETSKRIYDYYDGVRTSSSIFTDLGLAPGLINIMAEKACDSFGVEADQVDMMVGGLPEDPALDYLLTWSIEGLYNEYTGQCDVLRDGNRHQREALGRITKTRLFDTDLEAAPTKGAAAQSIESMKARGVKDFAYNTLRHPGHFGRMKKVLKDIPYFKKVLNASTGVKEAFCHYIESLYPKQTHQRDIILGRVKVMKKGPINHSYDMEFKIKSGFFSAMQKGTAYPIAAVAKSIIESSPDFEHRVLNYGDVHWEEFMRNLDIIDSKLFGGKKW